MKRLLSFFTAVLVFLSCSVVPVSAEGEEILNYRSDFLWGQNMHANGKGYDAPAEYSEEAVHLAAQQGVQMIRYNPYVANGDWTETDYIVGLCNKYGIKVMFNVSFDFVDEPTQEDLDLITLRAETYAKRYNGENGRGKVDYFQLWNEREIHLQAAKYGGGATSGQNVDSYFTISVPGKEDLVEWAKYMKAASKGIRNGSPDAKIVINFSWVAFGCIRYYAQEGVDFDYIGWDWYPDNFDVENSLLDFEVAMYGGTDSKGRKFTGLREVLPQYDVIICESNTWVKGYNTIGGYGDYNNTNMTADTYKNFIEIMKVAYQQPWIKAFCAFKLTDSPSNPSESERHYGHIFTELGGKIIGPKPIYHLYQNLIGGPRNVERVLKSSIDLKPYDALKVKTQDDSNINQYEPIVTPSVDDTEMNTDINDTTDTEPDVEQVIVKPDDIYKKTTSTITHNKMPWVLIISVGVGMLVLFGAGFATFLIVRRKKGL